MAEKDTGSRERRTRLAETVDAITEAGNAVARWSPQQAIVVMCVLILAFLLAGFAGLLWIGQEREREGRRENRETLAALMREFNAQVELNRVNCETTRDRDKRAAEERETRLLAVLAAESEKNRTATSAAMEKFTREVVAAIKTGKP